MAKTIHRPEYAVLRHALRDLRAQRGVTQAQLADALGRSQAFVSEVERGSRRLDVLELVDFCRALNASAACLVADLEAGSKPFPKRRREDSHR